MAECPREALADRRLKSGPKVVLAVLWGYAGASGRFVWPSRQTLAAACGVDVRTLRRHLATLRELEWITEAEGTSGQAGWHLCDPPGTPARTGDEAPTGEHSRASEADRTDRTADNPDREPDKSDRTELTGRTELTAEADNPDRSYSIGTNHEPTTLDGGSTVQPCSETNARGGGGLLASTWSGEFSWTWRSEFDAGPDRPTNPAVGARRLPGLQEALDEHGPDVVREVTLFAGREVQRHLAAGGKGGATPGQLAVMFRLEAPSFGVFHEQWAAAQSRKRPSGRFANAPAELDGIPMTNADQRAWMRACGDSPEAAVRESRRAREDEAKVSRSVQTLVAGFSVGGAS